MLKMTYKDDLLGKLKRLSDIPVLKEVKCQLMTNLVLPHPSKSLWQIDNESLKKLRRCLERLEFQFSHFQWNIQG